MSPVLMKEDLSPFRFYSAILTFQITFFLPSVHFSFKLFSGSQLPKYSSLPHTQTVNPNGTFWIFSVAFLQNFKKKKREREKQFFPREQTI
jgi:hypothetical protein